MRGIIGIVFVMVCVFGGYIASGGKFDVIFKALPYELTIIFGGAIGALIIGNPGYVIKGAFGGIKKTVAPNGRTKTLATFFVCSSPLLKRRAFS